MADNSILNAGAGGDTYRSKDRGGAPAVKTQIVALDINGTGASEVLSAGDAANGLDVDVTRVSGTVTVDGSAVTQPVSAASLPLPAGAATSANQSTQTTALQLIDDVVHADDGALGKVAAVGAQFDDTLPGTTTENNIRSLRMSTRRELYTQIRDAAGNERGLAVDANNEIGIGAIRTSVTPGTAPANLGKAEDAVHASGDVGVMALGVANEANVAFGADGDYVPVGPNREGSVRTIGSRAHDAVDADGPVKVGHVAIAHGTNPTAVAAADRTNWYANRAGVPFVIGGHPNVITLETAYTAAQTDTAIVTVAAGLKIVVTQIIAACSNANTVNVGLRVGFGATTTPTTTGVVLTHPGIAAGSGISRGDGSGMIGVGADGEDLRITSDVPTGGSVRVNVSYYTIES